MPGNIPVGCSVLVSIKFGRYLMTCEKHYSDRREPKDKIVNAKKQAKPQGAIAGFLCNIAHKDHPQLTEKLVGFQRSRWLN
jgi:hypothetical protein